MVVILDKELKKFIERRIARKVKLMNKRIDKEVLKFLSEQHE